MGNFIGGLFNYGLPGVALGVSLVVGAYARKNEKRINSNETQQVKILENQKEINRKLNVIGDHFMIKGMEK